MTFIENLEQMCRVRGESVSHALEACGLDKSLYPKWKKKPNFTPRGTTVQALCNYFGCSFQTLEPNGRNPKDESDISTALNLVIRQLDDRDKRKLLAYILFTYQEELPDEMQKLRTSN